MPFARAVATAALLAAVSLSGCLDAVEVPGGEKERVVSGDIESAHPTQRFLNVYLRAGAESTLVRFDRVDWYVAGLERAFTGKEVLAASIRGEGVESFHDVVALAAVAPESLNDYRYEEMERRSTASGDPFNAVALDGEWDARLATLAAGADGSGVAGVGGAPLDAAAPVAPPP